jgi:Protein of unknown function (DUF551)
MRTFITFKCKHCGDPFYRRLGDTKKATFCSRRCHALCHIAGKNKKPEGYMLEIETKHILPLNGSLTLKGKNLKVSTGETAKDLIVWSEDEWISVKVRMPKIDEFPGNEVLTWDGEEMWCRIPSFYDDGTCEFFTFDEPEITHWMPLPEPPK